LNSEKGAVQKKLEQAKQSLKSKTNKKDGLQKELKSKGNSISRKLKDAINERERYLSNSLKPALMEEPSVSVLRSNILSFQRDCVEILQDVIESTYRGLMNEYGKKSFSIMSDINSILGSLSSEASSSVQSIQVSHKKVKVGSNIQDKKAGAALGGALGAGAGLAVAGTATTVGITAAGTIGTVAAFGTMATIGIGILTGGVGLLLGAAAAGMLSKKGSSSARSQPSYVEYDEMVNNRRAMLAVERFLSKLKNNVNRMSEMMVNSLLKELVKPIDRQITSQNNLINQINTDLNQTVEDQQSTRDFLASKTNDVKNINSQYVGLVKSVERV